MKVYSFDIFDTCLTRLVADPDDVHWYAAHLFPKDLRSIFSPDRYRQDFLEAARLSRLNSENEETSLQEIITQLAARSHLSPSFENALITAELDTERTLLQPLEETRRLIASIRKQGARVIFISDTYHSSDFLSSELAKRGFALQQDVIYTSSEMGYRKLSGKLFDVVCQRERISPTELTHTGNDPISDLQTPKQKGIRCHFQGNGNLTRAEIRLQSNPPSGHRILSNMASAARIVRNTELLSHPLHRLFLTHVAPIVVSFVLEAIRLAEARKISLLCFLARDSQLLFDAFNALQSLGIGTGLEACYVYGSRRAWAPLAFQDSNSFGEFLERLARDDRIPTSWLNDFAPDAMKSVVDNFPPPSSYNRQYLEKVAIAHPRLLREISQHMSTQRELLTRYLQQQRITAAGKVAIVDTGWTGYWQSLLANEIEQRSSANVSIFLLGCRDSRLTPCSREIDTFFFDERQHVGETCTPKYFARLIEAFLPANHGLTTHYTCNRDNVRPVMHQAAPSSRYYPAFREITQRYIHTLAPVLNTRNGLSLRDKRSLVHNLLSIDDGLTHQEASGLLSLDFNSTPFEKENASVAHPYTLLDIFQAQQPTAFNSARVVTAPLHVRIAFRLRSTLLGK